MKALVIDDNEVTAKLIKKKLESFGLEVDVCLEPKQSIAVANRFEPDYVFMDIMMPGVDGIELCRLFRKNPKTTKTKIYMVSARDYKSDRESAKVQGADGFLSKPVSGQDLSKILNSKSSGNLEVKFWGVRGTLPVPGQETLRYGGNTSCVEIKVNAKTTVIFDAGSGIKRLGDDLRNRPDEEVFLFISHAHWDHINGLPFFGCLYDPNRVVSIAGPGSPDLDFKNVVSGQMDSVYFPITLDDLLATVRFENLVQSKFVYRDFVLHAKLLHHPGNCLGYRLEVGDYTICYVTDQELGNVLKFKEEYTDLCDFVRGCDVLITDTTYLDDEYAKKTGWGHSSVSHVAQFAHDAEVKNLCIFHHDPDQNDLDIDTKLSHCQAKLNDLGSSTQCMAPSEGDTLTMAEEIKVKKSA